MKRKPQFAQYTPNKALSLLPIFRICEPNMSLDTLPRINQIFFEIHHESPSNSLYCAILRILLEIQLYHYRVKVVSLMNEVVIILYKLRSINCRLK